MFILFFFYRGHFIFMSPPLSFKRNIFILPFHKYVWFTYVGLVLTTIPLLYFASRLESKTRKIQVEDSDRCYKMKMKSSSLGEILMMNVAAFCTQGKEIRLASSVTIANIKIWFLILNSRFSYSRINISWRQTNNRNTFCHGDLYIYILYRLHHGFTNYHR